MPRLDGEARSAELRVLLPPSLKRQARDRARREGQSLSTLMMRALERYLEAPAEHPLADLAGRWAEESEDLADVIRAGRRSSSRATPEW